MSQLLLPSLGAPCDPRRSVLDQLTHCFRSDCGPREWCRPLAAPLQAPPAKEAGGGGGGKEVESSGSCVPKGCRRDEYPWGYHGVETADLPRMCDDGLTYCPNDESVCLPHIALGDACELNRDDSCAPPSDSSYNTTTLCLLQICRLAASPLAAVCQLEHTQYLGYDGHSPQPVVEVVTRDDCQAGLYCAAEQTPPVCVRQRAVGDACARNRECLTFNCDKASQTCDRPATDAGLHLSPLCFVLVGLAILLSLGLTVWLLARMHASHRAARRDEVRRYFAEQWSFRESITELHAAKTQASKEMRED
ncbi:hypothetical protein FA10DRAFT_286670 [Acaromyces ingoldii]|uniref:Dickkopf N-terminal cysteine-rich domain-containing protein n=1 Tax=Acaromyces ingoldii TaxID=215250 RepID=A0A316YP50_9BASI|nr:hypothetical protein FA10DRAFT_286670 [Acaromyces ingoldii]PWN91001.1 hypothetical protein FA10DRAFT_286670 [Acaromyces ingoldii]